MSLPRRAFVSGGVAAVLLVGGGAVATNITRRPAEVGRLLTPVQAHELALSGDITLIDIRRPEEWAYTGIGEGAEPLDMRRRDFIEALSALVEGDLARPIALICAGGVRSRRMSARLTEAGFTQIIDVPEGMMGSSAGPGWLARKLPILRVAG